MKRVISLLLASMVMLPLLPMVSAVGAEEPPKGTHYTYRDIVRRTWDMSYLATVPKKGEGSGEVTSTDPSSRYNEETGLYENWGGNADNTNYVRINPDNGYRVLADLKGPGYLTHLWTGCDWDGNLRIYIDGVLTVNMPFVEFVHGSAFSQYDQLSFKGNYVNMPGFEDGYQGAIHLCVPITYNESCVVEIDCDEKSSFYYMVGYYNLEEGASVEPFTYPLSAENEAALAEANAALNDTSVPQGDDRFSRAVGAGQTATLYEASSPGALEGFSIKLDIPEEEFDPQTSLTDWEIRIYWDGSDDPAVCMPLGDFFGTPYGLYENVYDSAGMGVAEDGTMYSTWYMPYSSAKITLTNRSDTARTVTASFKAEALTDAQAAALTRFHANWQRAYAREDDRWPDAQMLSVQGRGRYVGTVLHVYQIVDGIWWGEGDEKFFIDGEKFPTWYGTGSEDYFGYAWCGSQIFDFAYCGQTHNDGYEATGAHQVQGHGDKVNYRVHVLDNVCFQTSLETNIEKYFNESIDQYGATTYFYLTPETSGNHKPSSVDMTERLFNYDRLSGETLRYPGAYMSPRILDSNTAVKPWVQNVEATETASWEGDVHLFWQPVSKGKYLEVLLEIPETGNYLLNASLTGAYDYGQYEYQIDGVPVGRADSYSAGVTQINRTLGTVALTKGEHILKILCTGKNPSSANYYLGINYLEFVPVTDDENISVYYKGSSDLLTNLIEDTGTEPPHDQGLDPSISDDGSHLFWRSGTGDEITFQITVPQAGRYDLTAGYTAFTDFGQFQLLLDGEEIGGVWDAYSIPLCVKNAVVENLTLTEGNHTLTVRCIGKNEASAGSVLGIDFIKLERQPSIPDNSGLLAEEKKTAKTQLDEYAQEAYAACDELQEPHIKLAVAHAKVALCQAATQAEIDRLLSDAKAQIDVILATVYEEELEVGEPEDLLIEGADLPESLADCSIEIKPGAQEVDPAIWSQGRHLFWRATQAGDSASFEIAVSDADRYRIALAYTVAGDYGSYDVYLDDARIAQVDSYSAEPGVRTVDCGERELSAGTHTLKIVITGKNNASQGCFVGIDHLLITGSHLAEYKKSACSSLESYKSETDYTAEQWAAVQQAVAEWKAQINAASTTDEVVRLWKLAKTALDAIDSGYLDFDAVEYDRQKTPADFGWQSDGHDTNWSATADGRVFKVNDEGTNGNRIWKALIEDPEDFTVRMTVKVYNLRASIEIMGQIIEINGEHGNGHQLFDRESWSWYDAEDQICDVIITRINGGDLTVTLVGKGNLTPVTFTKPVENPEDRNVYIGVIDRGGSAAFADITASRKSPLKQLQETYTAASSVVAAGQGRYTDASWSALMDAYTAAGDLLEGPGADDTTIMAAADALSAALSGLESQLAEGPTTEPATAMQPTGSGSTGGDGTAVSSVVSGVDSPQTAGPVIGGAAAMAMAAVSLSVLALTKKKREQSSSDLPRS